MHNIRRINPYKSDTNVEDINPKNMWDDVNILSPAVYFCIILNLWHKVYNWSIHKYLDVNSCRSCVWSFSWRRHFLHIGYTFTRICDAFRKRVLTILTCLTLNGYKNRYVTSVWCSYTSNNGGDVARWHWVFGTYPDYNNLCARGV